MFVGTRADLAPLASTLSALVGRPDLETVVVTGVAFDMSQLERRLADEIGPGASRLRIEPLAQPVDAFDTDKQIEQGSRIADGARRLVGSSPFDRLVVLGDRWELLYVIPPFYLAGVPIVHIAGGDVTEGAIDERVRHAVTKLADVHCVASMDAADRLRQLGEPDDRIHVTGAPGLDRFNDLERLDDDALASLLNLPIVRPLALFTYHAPTAVHAAHIRRWADEALSATLASCGTVVATHPGFDVGRDEVLEALSAAGRSHGNLVVVEALGPAYPAVLAAADVVVGNSSSGVVEAASVGVPAVDIGERQRGRLRGNNVLWADEGERAVRAALRMALSPEFRARAAAVVNPYGDGTAAGRIVSAIVEDAPPRTKRFIDLRS